MPVTAGHDTRSHLRRGGNRPGLAEMALAAVEDFGLYHARRSRVGGAEAEVEARILADRYVGFEAEYRLAVIGDIQRLHKVSRDVVAGQLVYLQPRICSDG